MKNIFAIALICAPIFLFSQSEKLDKPYKPQLEIFAEQSGTPIEKVVEEIGKAGLIKINVVKLQNLNTGVKISALSVEYSSNSFSILDSDEIDGLLKALSKIKEAAGTPRTNYTEVSYKSRTGFEVVATYTFSSSGSAFGSSGKKWNYHLNIGSSSQKVTLQPEDFMAFCGYVEAAKSKL